MKAKLVMLSNNQRAAVKCIGTKKSYKKYLRHSYDKCTTVFIIRGYYEYPRIHTFIPSSSYLRELEGWRAWATVTRLACNVATIVISIDPVSITLILLNQFSLSSIHSNPKWLFTQKIFGLYCLKTHFLL